MVISIPWREPGLTLSPGAHLGLLSLFIAGDGRPFFSR